MLEVQSDVMVEAGCMADLKLEPVLVVCRVNREVVPALQTLDRTQVVSRRRRIIRLGPVAYRSFRGQDRDRVLWIGGILVATDGCTRIVVFDMLS